MTLPASRSDRGFTLVEVLAAMLLITVATVAVSELFVLAVRANLGARQQTSTTLLAAEKLEQLRALTWGFIGAMTPVAITDSTTDLSIDPHTTAGTGLGPSPPGVLDANVPGYVDYLDANGRWVGTGGWPPATAVFIRRWSVRPLPTNGDTLVLQVLVTTVMRERDIAGASGPRLRHLGDALMTTVRTRKGS